MARVYSLTPKRVPRVETPLRGIVTEFPVPQAEPIVTKLHACEPVAMRGRPPVVRDHAEGFQVYDPWGNKWIDWSSGVLIANAGHGRRQIVDAIMKQASSKLPANYCFPSEIRPRMAETPANLLPEPLKKVFPPTTGSETAECAIKLCRTHGVQAAGRSKHIRSKHIMVTFEKAFHGRTPGSQQAGGIPSLKDRIVNLDPGFAQVPFPDGFRTEDKTFAGFEQAVREQNIRPQDVAGVMLETHQGGSAAFAPKEYMQAMRQWCTRNNALSVCDEVQAGFGRTGTFWGFEHYGIVPDLALFGKGIPSSPPISAVAGRADVMDLHPAGSMTSTHTGNPVRCAAAPASIDLVVNGNPAGNAGKMGAILHCRPRELQSRFPQIGQVDGKGLVAGIACVKPAAKEPDGDPAREVFERCLEKGVLLFSPVGFGGGTVKIAPPLVITAAAIDESVSILEEAFAEAVNRQTAVA